jgi:hypothetical protein
MVLVGSFGDLGVKGEGSAELSCRWYGEIGQALPASDINVALTLPSL